MYAHAHARTHTHTHTHTHTRTHSHTHTHGWQLDQLILQKREEQKFNSMIEKQLKQEQVSFCFVVRSLLVC